MSSQGQRMDDDVLAGRPPTSHERMSGQPWDASYRDSAPPWDIGRPQPAIVRLAAEGTFGGDVLDVGCGTGENALHIASLGLSVLGVDVAPTAVSAARTKASDRSISVDFAAEDAFHLERLGRSFDTVLDCGLFHSFDAEERTRYVAGLTLVTRTASTVFVLCFSDQGPNVGPHPVAAEQLTDAFAPDEGWHLISVKPERICTRFHDHDGAPAWLATVIRM